LNFLFSSLFFEEKSKGPDLASFWFYSDLLLAWEIKAKPDFDFSPTPFWHGKSKKNQTQTRLSLFAFGLVFLLNPSLLAWGRSQNKNKANRETSLTSSRDVPLDFFFSKKEERKTTLRKAFEA
jgi:hypothetical protein